MAKEQVNMLVQKEHIDALTQKDLQVFGQEVQYDEVKNVVAKASKNIEKAGEVLDKIDQKEVSLDSKTADVLVRAYASAQNMQAIANAKIDDIKKAVRQALEDQNMLEVKAESVDLKFTLSTPKTVVNYDLDALKADRPDIYKEVTSRAGKPMKKSDRKSLEDEIEKKKQELAELNKKLAEDNAAKQVIFSQELMDAKIANDETLAKYKTSITASKNFYFKNYKD